jgi:proteasome activator subunit 4
MAFVCNALCKVNPTKALKRLVPMLIQAIRTEIDENGAGSTRNNGVDVLPRDRGLVWNISMLSMCVVHVGGAVLDYKEDLFNIALYMQEKCRGNSTVHVSNFIHHLLLNLTGTYTVDYSLYDPEVVKKGLQPEHWGMSGEPSDLKINWHVPSHAEIEFAVRLFQSHSETALNRLTSLIGDSSPVNRDGTDKEWSDEVSRNLVLIRLILAGTSVLFDTKSLSEQAKRAKEANGSAHAPNISEKMQVDGDEINGDSLAGENEEEEKPTFHYPTGYPLESDSSLYATVHELREKIGEVLHEVHKFLTSKQEDDVSCFNALYTAYRSWFVDVGLERSAHVLDRVTRLLASDQAAYKVSGLRKDYPRPILLRRAHLYHLQRLRHDATPRARSHLEETLLLDLAESSVSLYTAIRRTAQNASESAMKAVIGARPLIIPTLVKALESAIKTNEHPRIKGALFTLLLGSMSKTLARDWRFTPSFIRSFIAVSAVDKPSIQKLTAGATYQVMELGRPLERMIILDKEITDLVAPAVSVEDRISKKRNFVQHKREKTERAKADLVPELVELAKSSHWKIAGRTASILGTLGLRFETLASDDIVKLFTKGAIDAHPGLRGFYAGALVMVSIPHDN